MPHHKACKKAILTNQKAHIKNRAIKSQIHTATKKVVGAKTKEAAEVALKEAFSIIDKASKTNVIHKNTASNRKSRLALRVQKMA
jgi:small subunit ribosomal protein S20